MLLRVILSLLGFVMAMCYNIDLESPIFYTDGNFGLMEKKSESYFGYTVIIYSSINHDWLIVGAPRGNSSLSNTREPGIVYRCDLRKSDCEYISPTRMGDETGYINNFKLRTAINKNEGWYGAAIAVDQQSGVLTICAPRTIITIYITNFHEYLNTMQGMCYRGLVNRTQVVLEDKNSENYDYSTDFWYDPLHGFSVHHSSSQNNNKRDIKRIIGEPKHDIFGTVQILQNNKIYNHNLTDGDEMSLFGYSVTSGRFFKKKRLFYVSSAPGWKYVGLVMLIDAENYSFTARIQGEDLGEYFGASLAVGDFNADGFDDLVVGSPHWKDDTGKVYIYFGSFKEKLEGPVVIEGTVDDSLFGYSLACGDLDMDGFDDIIVGAPWEDSGVIYVYNGQSVLKELSKIEYSQRISARQLSKDIQISRFGFSISKPVTPLHNRYPQIAVGAYKSGHVAVFDTRLVLKTNLKIWTTPSILQRNSSSFVLHICTKYSPTTIYTGGIILFYYKLSISIDEGYQRVLNRTFSNIYSLYPPRQQSCDNYTITLLKNIKNYIDPINMIIKHEFYNHLKPIKIPSFSSLLYPVEYKNEDKTVNAIIPFDIECGKDEICHSDISIQTRFEGVLNHTTWIIGSNDIALITNIKNSGEPAYLLTVTYLLPENVALRSILPFCQEEILNYTSITCAIGNPLDTEENKTIKLDLDMKHVNNGSLHNEVLKFILKIKTQSLNRGIKETTVPLILSSEAILTISGKANEENYYLSLVEEQKLNISFHHIFQILKFGATQIEAAELIMKVPVAIGNSSFIYIYEPQLLISNKLYRCSGININFLKSKSRTQIEKEARQNEIDLPLGNYVNRKNMTDFIINTNSERTKRDIGNVLNKSPKQFSNLFHKNSKNKSEIEVEVIYLNCSSPNITCGLISCDLSAIRNVNNIGQLNVNFILDMTGFKDTFKNNKILNFSTETHVTILEPSMSISTFDKRSVVKTLNTIINCTVKNEKINILIILISIGLGLIIVSICILILSKFGFFKRIKKAEISKDINQLKSDEHQTSDSMTEST